MIKQIDNSNKFLFSMVVYKSLYRYGDDPYLDSIGATSHLTPTYGYYDNEAIKWIHENNMTYEIVARSEKHTMLQFKNDINATAFKLKWVL